MCSGSKTLCIGMTPPADLHGGKVCGRRAAGAGRHPHTHAAPTHTHMENCYPALREEHLPRFLGVWVCGCADDSGFRLYAYLLAPGAHRIRKLLCESPREAG